MKLSSYEKGLGIEVKRLISQDEVISKLYDTRDLSNQSAYPYRDATISIEKRSPEELNPTQLYVIQENIETQRQIRNFLLENYDEDTLDMTYGAIEVAANGSTEVLLPPIVEESYQLEKPVILDGTHRALLALSISNFALGHLYVRNIDSEHDIAHRRLPNGWDEIITFTTHNDYLQARAEGFVHRKEGADSTRSYRDFSHLIGVQRCGRA